MTLEICIEFVQQLERISDFSETTHDNAEVLYQVEETVQRGTGMLLKTEVNKCKNCNFEHVSERQTALLFGKPVTTATKWIIFKPSVKFFLKLTL